MHALLLLAGCSSSHTPTPRVEPSFIEVLLNGFDTGSEESPLPFSSSDVTASIAVQTLDLHGDAYPFEGDLTLRVRPGKLSMDNKITVTGGTWEGDVVFRNGFGPTRIWVADEGDKDTDSGRAPSYGTGVTEAIHYEFPTISEMQDIEDNSTNHLAGEFAELRAVDRNIAVTVLGTNGFWATDLDDEPGSHNSLFVYTFSKPDRVEIGTRLTQLNGANQEYLQSTQLSFPTYQVEEDAPLLTVLDPVEIDPKQACDPIYMEGFEATVVQVNKVVIPTSFTPGSEDYEDFLEFGQWPIELPGGCVIFAESSVTVPGFWPPDHVGETLETISGPLTEVFDMWVIGARGESDIGGVTIPEGPPAQKRSRMQPRKPKK